MAQFPTGIDWPPPKGLGSALATGAAKPFSAYMHVPFCEVRCGYCDFNTYTSQFGLGADRATYSNSVAAEITQAHKLLKGLQFKTGPLQTVFFGGGTPTLLEAAAFRQMLDALRETFGVDAGAEITVEANPDSVTEETLAQLKSYGVNRLSVGVQSAVPHVLKILDRTHRQESVSNVAKWARQTGLELSFDLIYGTPGESISDWRRSLDFALNLAPDHVSAYSLVIEQGTKMAAQVARGEIPPPDEDASAEKYELADAALSDGGYGWYEISNFAKIQPGEETLNGSKRRFASRHNLAYWRNWNWWGFGPGAHSHVGQARWWNVKHPLAYAQRTQSGENPALQGEILDEQTADFERLMLGIRTVEGIDATAYQDVTGALVADGLIDESALTSGRAVLTLRGRLLADHVTRVLAGW